MATSDNIAIVAASMASLARSSSSAPSTSSSSISSYSSSSSSSRRNVSKRPLPLTLLKSGEGETKPKVVIIEDVETKKPVVFNVSDHYFTFIKHNSY